MCWTEVARRQAAGQARWAGVRATRVGLSGHSLGAHTTLGMAGQRYPGHPGIDEPRLAAFVAFSPTLPAIGNPQQVLGRITRPMFEAITGTRDDDVVGAWAPHPSGAWRFTPPCPPATRPIWCCKTPTT